MRHLRWDWETAVWADAACAAATGGVGRNRGAALVVCLGNCGVAGRGLRRCYKGGGAEPWGGTFGGPRKPRYGRTRLAPLLQGWAVDWVISFAEGTPENLLTHVRPDVLVKGGDYSMDQVVGADIVSAYGGTVKVLGLVENSSTTAIVEKIRSR